MITMRTKTIKCPICREKYSSINRLLNHIGDVHADTMPPGFTPARYFYYLRTGKNHGNCIVCKSPTEWIEESQKYSRYCKNPKCKENYRDMFKKRMIGVYGKTHIMDDPNHQRKLLSSKRNSGKYKFKDGGEVEYASSYELDFLKFIDTKMNFKSSDIMGPSPHTYYYEYKNSKDKENEGRKFYIPDYYIPSLNLEIEIKQNTSTHPKILRVDKVKEELKDALMVTIPNINYIKVTDKKYDDFIKTIEKLRNNNNISSANESFIDINFDKEEFFINPYQKVHTDVVTGIIDKSIKDIHVEHNSILVDYAGSLTRMSNTLSRLSTKKLSHIKIAPYIELFSDNNKLIDMKLPIHEEVLHGLEAIEANDLEEDILLDKSHYMTVSELIKFIYEFKAIYMSRMLSLVYKRIDEDDLKASSLNSVDKDFLAGLVIEILFSSPYCTKYLEWRDSSAG